MKNLLLGIIAINLTFISFNLALRSVEPVQAETYRSDIEYVVHRMLNTCWLNPSGDRYYMKCDKR